MNSTPQSEFEVTMRRLDALLPETKATLIARGIEVRGWTDYSRRDFNSMWWRWFDTYQQRGFELEKVSVDVKVREEKPNIVFVKQFAAIFQTGQPWNRWQDSKEYTVPLDELFRDGIAAVVIAAVEDGKAKIRSAP